MDFELSAEQRFLQQTARAFLERAVPPARSRALAETAPGMDPELWGSLVEQGWLGMAVSESRGGLGLGMVELAAVWEMIGRACLPGPLFGSLWGVAVLEAACESADDAARIEPFVSGQQRAAVAWLEEDRSWELGEQQLRAERRGNDWRLTGRKSLVLDALGSDVLLVVARATQGIALFEVATNQPGLRMRTTPCYDLSRRLAEVEFDGTNIPTGQLLALDTRAETALERGRAVASVALSAELLGAMQWALEATVAYAQQRQQFGRAVGSFQAVQQQCADMLLWVESARSAVYYAAWSLTAGAAEASTAVALAKAYTADAARETLERAIQVHGGIGFTWEHDLQRFYKRVRSSEMLLGDASEQRERLATMILR